MQVVNFHHYGSTEALTAAFGERWRYIGRPNKRFALPASPLANRYSHNPLAHVQEVCTSREEAITRYTRWLQEQVLAGETAVCDELARLDDQSVLVCWCAPQACHGHVIQRWYQEQRVAYVNLGGSRDLSRQWQSLVQRVVSAVHAQGRGIAVGCARGADAFALEAALEWAAYLRIFAIGGRDGRGFWRQSAVETIAQAEGAGRWIHWWAGGPCPCPSCQGEANSSRCPTLIQRLSARTQLCLQFAAGSGGGAGFIGFLARPDSPGTVACARLAVHLGLPVILFPCGFNRQALPTLGNGRWTVAGREGVWAAGCRWMPTAG